MSLFSRCIRHSCLPKVQQNINHNSLKHSINHILQLSSDIYHKFTQQISVPNLGDSITEGTISAIHKNVGERVYTDDIVLEIETDKVSVDIRAPTNGYIAEFFSEINNDVEVGAALYLLSDEKIEGITDTVEVKTSEVTSEVPSVKPILSEISNARTDSSVIHSEKRLPLMQFRYGIREMVENVDKVLNGISTDVMGTQSSTIVVGLGFRNILWSEEDIEAVNSGGASLIA